MNTAAQHKRSANKNRYKILYPFEDKTNTNIHNIRIIILTLLITFFPLKFLLICFPFIISKLEIAFINVSIVLKVNDTAKIKIITIIYDFFLLNM